MSSEERPSKRPRDDDPELKTSVQRSADYWFEDGSIVLQVESTQFRVAKTILAMHSTVFRDMLSLPPTNEPLVEGCPVVHLPGDRAEDWEYLLRSMFPKTTFGEDVPSLDQISGVLRLSQKYDIPAFRRACVSRLCCAFPARLAASDDKTRNKNQMLVPKSDERLELTTFCIKAVNLAREVGLFSILPYAFYIICAAPLASGFWKNAADPKKKILQLYGTLKASVGARRVQSRPRFQVCLLPIIIYHVRDLSHQTSLVPTTMTSEERPTKRSREDGDVQEPAPVRRSTTYWFEDGSIVLQVESTQFRVAKTILAMHSTVFRDMLSLPPVDQAQVEGCPVVYLPGDRAEDWEHLLCSMYPKQTFSEDLPTFDEIAAVLRLSQKYDIPAFRKTCVARLCSEYPVQLPLYEQSGLGMQSKIKYPADLDKSQLFSLTVKVVNLAREVGLYSVLPYAFYHIASSSLDTGILSEHFHALGVADQITCLQGHARLLESYRQTPFKCFAPFDGPVPCQSCPTEERCRRGASMMLGNAFSRAKKAQILEPWSVPWNRFLCDDCLIAAKAVYAQSRAECWEKLPSYFGLPAWDELLRMNLE
ncbi:BTB domain-containing protein [Mycena kentingensis (nom. inval.)]|nr:BTB domain-containing protein [Mycena kentingensis (nom. inval.)]